MSRKTALALSLTLVLLFLLLLAVSALTRSGGTGLEVVTQREASREELLRGGNPEETPAPVMPGDLIDLNTADMAELQRLPGIGENLARAVLEWRGEHGPFRDISQLKNVPGIGESLYRQLEAYLTTGDET